MKLSLATVQKLRTAAETAFSKTTPAVSELVSKASSSDITWPTYDPAQLKPGILHVGYVCCCLLLLLLSVIVSIYCGSSSTLDLTHLSLLLYTCILSLVSVTSIVHIWQDI